MSDRKRIAALLAERERAERAGDRRRVEELSAELRRLGDQATPPVKQAARRGGSE